MERKKRGGLIAGFLKENIISLVLFAAVAAVMLYGLGSVRRGSDAEGKRVAEESIRRAVVSCYAIEGEYPQSYEYLKENYGLRIDESRYYIRYEIFASNIMPEISVIEVAG